MSPCNELSITQAVSVVLQHPAVAADQQNICRMLQVCKAWRTAVQQSDAGLADIKLSASMLDGYGTRSDVRLESAVTLTALLSRWAHWLSNHAGTVRSIDLHVQGFEKPDNEQVTALKAIIHDVVALGLRAAVQASTVPGCSTGSVIAAAYPAVTRPLQLQSFKCNWTLACPPIVSALPAATLTRLQLSLLDTVTIDAQLSSLSNLRSLKLESGCQTSFLGSYLCSINKLSKLTSLTLESLASSADLSLLPQQLCELDLYIESVDDQPANLNISHLTALQQLRADVWCDIEPSVLPAQLQALEVIYCNSALAALDMASMQQLRQLSLGLSQDSPEQLLMLNQLQGLEDISLQYADCRAALEAAPVWFQLKQLSTLYLGFSCVPTEIAPLMDAWCQLTWLTELGLDCTMGTDDPAGQQAVEEARERISRVCQSLKELRDLQKLSIHLDFALVGKPDDVLHLSNLTALTYLCLRSRTLASSTCTIAALLELTGLQDLTMSSVREVNVLPVIGKLKHLTSLSLPWLPPDVQQEGLMYLSQLRKLQSLDGFESCSKIVMDQFWADLRA